MNHKTANKITPNPAQSDASNPLYSVWVSASAGTGKTAILINRILRLLLNNVDISKIVCLTFSKKAANEMISRLMSALSKWSILSEEELDNEIFKLTNTDVTPSQTKLAQELFAIVLDNQHNIKIQTIHSFCQEILYNFPFEANIAPNFVVLEDNSFKKKLQEDAIKTVLQKDYNNVVNIKNLSQHFSNYSFLESIVNFLKNSLFIEKVMNFHTLNSSNLDDYKKALYTFIKAHPNKTSQDMEEYFFDNINFEKFANILPLFNNHTKIFQNYKQPFAETFHKVFFHKENNMEIPYNTYFQVWKDLFFTVSGDLKPRELNFLKDFIGKSTKEEQQAITDAFNEEQLRLESFEKEYKNQKSAEINMIFIEIAIKIYEEYKNIKLRYNLLDFNDIIQKSLLLMQKSNIMPWLMYKLDQNIEHILVDEAQDTSPSQWEIIKYFVEEFYSGNSAFEKNEKQPLERTIFAVGDIKQSIYRFQGANPQTFSDIKNYFKQLVQNANQKWLQIPLKTSYRSSYGIINVVNSVTANIFNNLEDPYLGEDFEHINHYKDKNYNIEIWPLITKVQGCENPHAKEKNLASAIANKMILLHNNGVAYGDMLVLYDKRKGNITLEYLVKILKIKNIPVLGVDKIDLKEHIVIQDLIHLSKFILQNSDDFSLASVLKSPLFNLIDEDILYLTTMPEKISLYKKLQISKFVNIAHTLANWCSLRDSDGVFALFHRILYLEGILEKIIQRIGIEAKDPITEFMNLTLDFKKDYTDDLQSFLEYITKQELIINRDTSVNETSVRLLTVHGSKGLQAKVIFLINKLSSKDPSSNILPYDNTKNPLILLKPNKQSCSEHINHVQGIHKINDYEEKKRLLYVALTRAEESLYVCSLSNDMKDETKENWLTYIKNSYNFDEKQDSAFSEELGFSSNKVLYISHTSAKKKEIPKIIVKAENTHKYSWISENPQEDTLITKPISPSKIDFDDKYNLSPLQRLQINVHKVTNKGILIHKILEQLNSTNVQDYNYILNSYIKNYANILEKEDTEEIKDIIKNIITKESLKFIFHSNSFNEVSLSGLVKINNDTNIILARVDKIIKLDSTIIIIDYKYTKKKHPTPSNYIKQMSIYKKLLQQIYPSNLVESYILYTQTAELEKI